MKKIQPCVFPLARQNERVALLLNVMDGTVTVDQVAKIIEQDVATRPVRKPVVAFERRFGSVTEAAHWAIRWKPDFGQSGRSVAGEHARLERVRKLIARKCNQDCWAGFYWSE
jgi:hypothetical protein